MSWITYQTLLVLCFSKLLFLIWNTFTSKLQCISLSHQTLLTTRCKIIQIAQFQTAFMVVLKRSTIKLSLRLLRNNELTLKNLPKHGTHSRLPAGVAEQIKVEVCFHEMKKKKEVKVGQAAIWGKAYLRSRVCKAERAVCSARQTKEADVQSSHTYLLPNNQPAWVFIFSFLLARAPFIRLNCVCALTRAPYPARVRACHLRACCCSALFIWTLGSARVSLLIWQLHACPAALPSY